MSRRLRDKLHGRHRICCSHSTSHRSIASYVRPESPTPPEFDAPIKGSPSEYRRKIWCAKTRMVWLPDSEKILRIRLFVLTEFTNVTDGRTDIQTVRHHRTA